MKHFKQILALSMSLAILLCSIPVYADSLISQVDTNIEIDNDGFGDSPDDGGATPFWVGHQGSVDTQYGTHLTEFLQEMSLIPDQTIYNMKDSLTNGNHLGLTSGQTIPLTNGSNFSASSETAVLRYRDILHGRGNYVASLRFLYTVARNLVRNNYSGTRINIIDSAIKDALNSTDVANNTFYGENKSYAKTNFTWTKSTSNGYDYITEISDVEKFTSLQQRITIEKCIYLVANTDFDFEEKDFNTLEDNAYDEVSKNYNNIPSGKSFEIKTALKLIGVATHLCGDIYAHKTVVPLNTTFTATTVPSTRDNSTIYRGTATDFNGNGRWSAAHGIKTLITGGSTITTQQITQWQFGSNGTSYPDYKNFYYERWNVATKQLVAEMYDNFFGKASLAYNSFFINWFLHTNYSLKLANLKLYAYSIGSEPAAEDKLSRLNALDSAVAISDVVPAGGYKTPSDSGNQWKKGYVSSY